MSTIMSKTHDVRVEGQQIIQYKTPHGKHQLLLHAHTSIGTQSTQRIKYTKILFHDILTYCQGFDMLNPNPITVGSLENEHNAFTRLTLHPLSSTCTVYIDDMYEHTCSLSVV